MAINSTRIVRTGHVARIGEMRTTHIHAVKNPDGMKTAGRPNQTCENNIKTVFKKMRNLWSNFIGPKRLHFANPL